MADDYDEWARAVDYGQANCPGCGGVMALIEWREGSCFDCRDGPVIPQPPRRSIA